MSLKVILSVNGPLRRCLRTQFGKRYFAASTAEHGISGIPADEKPIFQEDEEAQRREEEIALKRDKSKLRIQHRNMLHGIKPYDESKVWYHETVKYKRKVLGKYGMEAAGVPAGVAWPTVEEVEDVKERERVTYPVALRDAWAQIEEKHKKEAEAIRAREADIAAKLMKMDKWKEELQMKIDKKRKALEAAKAHKEKLIEEIRQHFGFKIDTHDVRFKEMLEKKEKEAKKMKKEEKQKYKEERLRQKLEELNAKQFGNKTIGNNSTEVTKPETEEPSVTETNTKSTPNE